MHYGLVQWWGLCDFVKQSLKAHLGNVVTTPLVNAIRVYGYGFVIELLLGLLIGGTLVRKFYAIILLDHRGCNHENYKQGKSQIDERGNVQVGNAVEFFRLFEISCHDKL
jgi:hypothetical protein